jgi:hypothetical protein
MPCRSTDRLSALPPEVTVEDQQECSLHEHTEPEASQHGLLASHQESGYSDVENVDPGVESEERQKCGGRLALLKHGEPANAAVDQSPKAAHELERSPELTSTGIESDRGRSERHE